MSTVPTRGGREPPDTSLLGCVPSHVALFHSGAHLEIFRAHVKVIIKRLGSIRVLKFHILSRLVTAVVIHEASMV